VRALAWRWRLKSDQCSWHAGGRVARVCRLNRRRASAVVTGISHIGQHSQKAAWRVVGGTAHQLSEVAYDRVNAGG